MTAAPPLSATDPSISIEDHFRAFVQQQAEAIQRLEAEVRNSRDAAATAEAASRAKNTFLADVSHEIRTPLNGVLGMAHLLLKDELSPPQRERVQVLKTSAESLLHVLNDLLDFSKMEAGKFSLSPVPFHLADEIGETMKWLALRAGEKDLRLSYLIEPGVPAVVVADPDRLRQVIVNLVGNAIKFTEHGEVAVRVGLDALAETSGTPRIAVPRLRLEVTDTGIGISSDRVPRIFDRFEQAGAETSHQFGGTGLGLAIVRRLATLMNGTLTVQSEAGRGSTFRFTAQLETTGGPRAGAVLPARFSDLRVLVVDGHSLSRDLLLEQLAAWGLEAVGTADGDQALEVAAAAGGPFEMVILDVGSAVDEALEILRRLRACGAGRAAIICTPPPAAIGVPKRNRPDFANAIFLARPFKAAELLDALIGVLHLTPPAWLVSRREATPPALNAVALRILLVEDNAVNREVAAGMLQAEGHVVRAVAGGRAALDALAAEPFDAVLMDLQMPEIDGFETTAAIRAAEAGRGRHMPVIALTARAMAGDREECLRRGMDDFVAKPIDPRDLQQVLGRLRPLAAGPLNPNQRSCADLPDPTAIFDEASFVARCGGRRGLALQVARIFLSECPRHLDRLRAALSAGDSAALQAVAHTLKGAVGNLSGAAAHVAAKRLEELARNGRLADSSAALSDLSLELDKLRSALRQLLAEKRASSSPKVD
jgi:signal transduction histidine kinase/DNA-binding response OmpR family regulator/HPt (histidine-containing phosphotransfer) domain-containing protein